MLRTASYTLQPPRGPGNAEFFLGLPWTRVWASKRHHYERALGTTCAAGSSQAPYFQTGDNCIHSPSPYMQSRHLRSWISSLMFMLERAPVEIVFCGTCSRLNHLTRFPWVIFCLVNYCFQPPVILPQDRKECKVMKRMMVADSWQVPFTRYIVPKGV